MQFEFIIRWLLCALTMYKQESNKQTEISINEWKSCLFLAKLSLCLSIIISKEQLSMDIMYGQQHHHNESIHVSIVNPIVTYTGLHSIEIHLILCC